MQRRSHQEGCKQQNPYRRNAQIQSLNSKYKAYKLQGQCHEIDIFWRSKHFNQYILCMRWWFSRSFQKLFTNLYYLKLLSDVENAYWNPLQNSLLYDWSMFSIADLSLAAGKMCTNSLVTGGFRCDFTESQAASCRHYQCQNCRFRFFEAGYEKDFQNVLMILKEQANTLS